MWKQSDADLSVRVDFRSGGWTRSESAEGPSETVAHSTLCRVWAGWGYPSGTYRQLFVWSSPSLAPTAAVPIPEVILSCATVEELSEGEPEEEVDLQSEGETAVPAKDFHLTCGCLRVLTGVSVALTGCRRREGCGRSETQPSTLLDTSGPDLEADMGVG